MNQIRCTFQALPGLGHVASLFLVVQWQHKKKLGLYGVTYIDVLGAMIHLGCYSYKYCENIDTYIELGNLVLRRDNMPIKKIIILKNILNAYVCCTSITHR